MGEQDISPFIMMIILYEVLVYFIRLWEKVSTKGLCV